MTLAIADDVPALVELAQRLCGNRADAEDLVQDTIERALRARYNERGTKKGWLATILRNRFRDRCREVRLEPMPLASIDHAPTPESEELPTWKRVRDEDLAAALAELDAGFREVYELHARGLSYAAIAAELGISINTVGTRLLRARAKLKQLLRAA